MRFSKMELQQIANTKHEILRKWLYPAPDPSKFHNWSKGKFNVLLVGKSGAGKSSLVETIFEKQMGKKISVEIGITETTMEPNEYALSEYLSFWDLPGYSTKNVEEGSDGKTYIRDFSIVWFDCVVIVVSQRITSFATALYALLRDLHVPCIVIYKIF